MEAQIGNSEISGLLTFQVSWGGGILLLLFVKGTFELTIQTQRERNDLQLVFHVLKFLEFPILLAQKLLTVVPYGFSEFSASELV